jgi:hypothetical protein
MTDLIDRRIIINTNIQLNKKVNLKNEKFIMKPDKRLDEKFNERFIGKLKDQNNDKYCDNQNNDKFHDQVNNSISEKIDETVDININNRINENGTDDHSNYETDYEDVISMGDSWLYPNQFGRDDVSETNTDININIYRNRKFTTESSEISSIDDSSSNVSIKQHHNSYETGVGLDHIPEINNRNNMNNSESESIHSIREEEKRIELANIEEMICYLCENTYTSVITMNGKVLTFLQAYITAFASHHKYVFNQRIEATKQTHNPSVINKNLNSMLTRGIKF